MKQLIFYCLLLLSSGSLIADTIDVWSMKINDRIIIQSNANMIHDSKPMELSLDSVSDNDTVKVEYWTDTRLQTKRWGIVLFDDKMQAIDTITNKFEVNNYRPYVAILGSRLRTYFKNHSTRIISCKYIHLSGRIIQTYDKDIICRFNTK